MKKIDKLEEIGIKIVVVLSIFMLFGIIYVTIIETNNTINRIDFCRKNYGITSSSSIMDIEPGYIKCCNIIGFFWAYVILTTD